MSNVRAPSTSFIVIGLVAHMIQVKIALASFFPLGVYIIDSSVLWYKGSISLRISSRALLNSCSP